MAAERRTGPVLTMKRYERAIVWSLLPVFWLYIGARQLPDTIRKLTRDATY